MELAELEKLVQLCDVLLVEADGAKCHPIKIPRTGEPVLPKKTYAVIGCAGLTCIGEPWEEACFRYELAPCIFGCLTMEDRISPDAISQILTSINGTRKGAESMEYRILFNQADSDVRLLYAQAAAETMGKQWAQYCAVTSFHTNDNANTGTGKGQTR
jgi:probable selenium-dependent hydroxylase accessory protein YqeC